MQCPAIDDIPLAGAVETDYGWSGDFLLWLMVLMPQRFAIGKNEMRTVRSVVRFAAPFMLDAADGTQPPGDYAIDQDEEAIDGLSRLAFQRVASFIYLPAIGAGNRPGMMAPITPTELEGAVTVDQNRQAPQTETASGGIG